MKRTTIVRGVRVGALALVGLLGAGSAWAATEAVELEEESSLDDDFEPEEEADDFEPDEDAPENAAPPRIDEAAGSPFEKAGETYYFVGARYRALVVPQFMINMFADGGTTFVVHGVGAEFGIRKDNFEILPSVWFANYSFEGVPFKGKSDGADAWEIIDANLKVLYLTADFLWSSPINEQFAITYGAGAGLGLVMGDITRTEGYFPGGLSGNPDGAGLARCNGPGGASGNQCPFDGEYNKTDDAWPVFPWLAVQTGLRYKPHRHFVARLDVGFSTSGLFFGLGADYGL